MNVEEPCERVVLSIIIPCYNEVGGIISTYEQIAAAASQCGVSWELLFVDDGSTDGTTEALLAAQKQDPRIGVIVFSRNFGHQAALTAGLMFARGSAMITLDADLQHPPEFIPVLFEHWRSGAKVVQAVRKRTKGSWSRALTSSAFYWLINKLSDTTMEAGAADFRLLDRQIVNYLNAMPERARFVRGQVAWLGFPSVRVEYDERERCDGRPKYSWRKLLRLARDAITSSSVRSMMASFWLGLALTACAAVYGGYALIEKFRGHNMPGWTSLLLAILAIGGIQFLVLSIHAIYLGQVYQQVQARPLFCVSEMFGVIATNEPTQPDLEWLPPRAIRADTTVGARTTVS